MSDLFIALYLDEDVNVLVAALLRARGFDVQTTRDAGRLTASDEDQLTYAAAQDRALLSHNRADFESLHRQYMESGQHHSGIILAIRRPPHEIAQRLLSIFDQVASDEIRDQLRYV